jgi:hypothetical protein
MHRTCRILSEARFKERQMPEWEYIKIDLNDLPRRTESIDLLNDAGKDGWELVALTSNNIAYLKRKIRRRSSAPAAATAPSTPQ